MISSQKILTRIIVALATVGILMIGLLWWDSTLYSSIWNGKRINIGSCRSFVGWERIHQHYPTNTDLRLERDRIDFPEVVAPTLFPIPQWRSSIITIPYYLILLTYLATLLLAWLLLMNRLARLETKKVQMISKR